MKLDYNKINKDAKLLALISKEVENNYNCPKCKSDYIIDHADGIYLCANCGNIFSISFEEIYNNTKNIEIIKSLNKYKLKI